MKKNVFRVCTILLLIKKKKKNRRKNEEQLRWLNDICLVVDCDFNHKVGVREVLQGIPSNRELLFSEVSY